MKDKDDARKSVLLKIQSHIVSHGHHVYVVTGNSPTPRYAYTIGISQHIGIELVLAGASFYSDKNILRIINEIATKLKAHRASLDINFKVDKLGFFSLQEVDISWVKCMLLGALDYYQTENIKALQIVPDQEHWTLDTPRLIKPWSMSTEPVWQWDYEPWQYPVPENSVAVTNLDALRGKKITEATRWEEDNWELFAGAGPDVQPKEIRHVPLGTLLAIDKSLERVITLGIGDGLWREPDDTEWHIWN
jgi:Domain of unknown function (DUF4262)